MTETRLRSVLYMPGINQRAMDKAKTLDCDAVVFDLEDAVAPDRKAEARELVLAQLAGGGYGERSLVVRANGLDTPWGEDDLRAFAGVERICLPKVESIDQLRAARALIGAEVTLWAMVETPRGIAEVECICAEPGLEAILMGTTDLAYQLRIPHRPDRLGLLYALSKCVNAARMHGKVALDGVFLDIRDADAYRQNCEHGRALGFDGKTLIHPSQIDAANAVFGVSDEQLAHARRVIEAWEAAEAAGKGVAVLDDKLVETMHVDEARRMLALAEATA
ncbi:MAG: CoA ester lyase [Halieaceae bacterium]|nr:CoA ester lyase [Halieaceae bacterium]